MSYYFNRDELEVIRGALWNSYMELYQFKPAIITQDNVQRLELVRRASTVRSETYNIHLLGWKWIPQRDHLQHPSPHPGGKCPQRDHLQHPSPHPGGKCLREIIYNILYLIQEVRCLREIIYNIPHLIQDISASWMRWGCIDDLPQVLPPGWGELMC